jgi:hypothetical protein
MSPGRSLCVRRPREVGGLGQEHTGTGQATHRVMREFFSFIDNFGIEKTRMRKLPDFVIIRCDIF